MPEPSAVLETKKIKRMKTFLSVLSIILVSFSNFHLILPRTVRSSLAAVCQPAVALSFSVSTAFPFSRSYDNLAQ